MNSLYFDHDYSARNDARILQLRHELGWTGYALFFATIECLCEAGGTVQRCELPALAFGLMYDKVKYAAFIESLIELGLLLEDESGIYSARIRRHIERRKKLSEAGRAGGKISRKPSCKPPLSHPISIDKKEDKEKEKEENAAAAVVVSSVKDLREIFFGEMFIDECCMRLHADKKAFTEFVHRWVTKKEIDGNYMYTKPKLRQYLLADWEKELKSPKSFNPDAPVKRMTKRIGEM